MGEVRAASVSSLSVGTEPVGDRQAAAGAQSCAARVRDLETVDLASIVDVLRQLDQKQLRRLVEDLDAALRDEVPTSGGRIEVAVAGDPIRALHTSAESEEGKEPGSEIAAPAPAPLQVMPAPSQAKANAATGSRRDMSIRVRKPRSRRPLVILASACLATIVASFLFVPAADPPPDPGAVAIQTSRPIPPASPTEQASTEGRSPGDVASPPESLPNRAASNQAGPGTESRAAVGPIPPPEARNKSEPGAIAPPSARHEITTDGHPSPSAPPSVEAQPKAGPPTASRSADTAEQAPHPKPIAPQSKAEAKPPLQAPTPDASASEPAKSQSPEMVQNLIERADYLLLQRDVAGARMFYERAAGAGSIVAASGAARTYDPLFLRWIGAVGIRGDKAKAIYWYRKASEGGDRASGERLTMLLSDRSE